MAQKVKLRRSRQKRLGEGKSDSLTLIRAKSSLWHDDLFAIGNTGFTGCAL